MSVVSNPPIVPMIAAVLACLLIGGSSQAWAECPEPEASHTLVWRVEYASGRIEIWVELLWHVHDQQGEPTGVYVSRMWRGSGSLVWSLELSCEEGYVVPQRLTRFTLPVPPPCQQASQFRVDAPNNEVPIGVVRSENDECLWLWLTTASDDAGPTFRSILARRGSTESSLTLIREAAFSLDWVVSPLAPQLVKTPPWYAEPCDGPNDRPNDGASSPL